MARPTKQGLEYFPFNINFFDDDKLVFVSDRFGIKGEIIAIRLLCRIYKEGYYTVWNDELAEMFSKRIGENITQGLVNDVVDELIKRDFFNKVIFDRFKILTSYGIQKRYLHACQQAKRKDSSIEEELVCSGFIRELFRKKPPIIPEIVNSIEVNNTEEKEIIEKEKSLKVFNELKLEFLNSGVWISDICRNYKLEHVYVLEKIHEFLNDLFLKEDFYKGLQEVRKHFISWLKIQVEKEKNSGKKEKVITQAKDITWNP